MKKIKDLIKNNQIKEFIGSGELIIKGISGNSNFIEEGWLFAAIIGRNLDGHSFIKEAIEKGAKAILCQSLPKKIKEGITYILVKNSAIALGLIADLFYDKPSSKLKLIGITGTNGKTSVASLLYDLFNKLGKKSGLISTISIKSPSYKISSISTTPDIIEINSHLTRMLKNGCLFVFMEVSSHGIDQNRISGLSFEGAVFTNITHDHLDYHGSFKNYLYSKKAFFDKLNAKSFALLNADDKNAKVISQNTKARKYTYGLKNTSDFKLKVLEKDLFGMKILIDGNEIWSRLIGNFNAYNLLAVYSTAFLLKKDHLEVLTILSSLLPPKGRFEQYISPFGIHLIVDYAHTPDALENILSTLIEVKFKESKLICLLGTGGNRDKEKRPLMGKIACKKANVVVFTSDNPRGEDPAKILEDMQFKLSPLERKKAYSIIDRKKAIEMAIQLAKPKDIVLLAGKGHENYQEIAGVKYSFDDMEIAREILVKENN